MGTSRPPLIFVTLPSQNEQYEVEDANNDGDCVNGVFDSDGCVCTTGFAGESCNRYVYDCKEALDTEVSLEQSLTHVMLKPKNTNLAFEALCNSNGHLAILARNTYGIDDVTFNKAWKDYQYPFGTVGNFWLGLEYIYAMLNQGDIFKLQIYCRNLDSEFSVFYETFSIQSESNRYQMTAGVKLYESYTNGSDGFGGGQIDVPFCTYDRPCNGYPYYLNGGWWYVSGLEQYALTNQKPSLKFKYQNNDISVHQVSMALVKL
ncbi:hypothetical protein LOTGIDRAFT_163997 [Lottia gigantea]|uniref:Fibrinogen C-terminal domain-containing protein n=1 Tax=Lottia gigantea TaxID=225164 RepID=V4A209_LOTGI|nr:hypothetical protein LOTGIDRAFT_163997 [Lottia gigantea]ESO90722.1 hypothetical protein LOTGIDRAFT_163997 [Lottia gigantea]